MLTAVCAGLLLTALGAAARYAQGNGYGGPGRISVIAIAMVAVWWGPLQATIPPTIPECVAALWFAALAGGNIAFGATDWKDIRYSLFRYSVPAFGAPLFTAMLTDNGWLFLYGLVGVLLTIVYYELAEHKPKWLSRLVGDRDAAAGIAGFVAIGGLVVLRAL